LPKTIALRELSAATRYHRGMNPDKPVHARNVPTPTERPRRQIIHEEIARRAKQLWQDRGEPSGSDEAIWLEAESQLQAEAESRPVSGTESRPYVDEPAKPVRSQSKSRDPSEAGAQTRSATDAKSKQSAGKIRNQ
jgi:hypothetical protein